LCNNLQDIASLHTCQATRDTDDSNSRVVSATLSLPFRETSSSFGLFITPGQGDHVIAPHSIVSLGMRAAGVSCTGQFIGSENNALLLEAITEFYGSLS
jgi:hypothetical protein